MDSVERQEGTPEPNGQATSAANAGPPSPSEPPHTVDGGGAADASHWMLRVRDSARIVLTALLLAFVFRAFFIEPFIIPTGSMAPGLLGDHWAFLCPVCGVTFHVNADDSWETSPPARVSCSNCRNWIDSASFFRQERGDRILVHKWATDVFPPERWDVIVFRDPALPLQNYIKRVVGLPGDAVEIRDGDLWINGAIARKSAHAQAALWIPVFSQDNPPDPRRDPVWRWAEAGLPERSAWSGLGSRVLEFHGDDGDEHTIFFVSDRMGEYQYDWLSNNNRSSGALLRDLRLIATVDWPADSSGSVEFVLPVPPWKWMLRISAEGSGVLACEESGQVVEEYDLTLSRSELFPNDQVEIGHLDRGFYARVNGQEAGRVDLSLREPADQAALLEPARVQITGGGGPFSLRHVRLERDVYYTHSHRTIRGAAHEPFMLNSDEYFVLGDNSHDSHDSREWSVAGPQQPADYRLGTVRGSDIVGRAALVYLPGAWHSWFGNLGRVRFIR